MLQCHSHISEVTCSSISYLVAGEVKRQQFLILLSDVAKS